MEMCPLIYCRHTQQPVFTETVESTEANLLNLVNETTLDCVGVHRLWLIYMFLTR